MFFNQLVSFSEREKAIVINKFLLEYNYSIPHFDFHTERIINGSCYFATNVNGGDGHPYIDTAIQKGASIIILSNKEYIKKDDENTVYILCEDAFTFMHRLANHYRNEILKAKVFGITGSNGKTTTKDILSEMLSVRFKTFKTPGNFNNAFGLPYSILNAPIDTECLVLEMGMSMPKRIEPLSYIAEPDYTIVTNVGESHLENFHSRNDLAVEKGSINRGIKSNGKTFLPSDCDLIDTLINVSSHIKNENIYLFGSENTNTNLKFNNFSLVEQTSNGTAFITNLFDEPLILPLYGNHNLSNAISCISVVANEFNFSHSEVQKGLLKIEITPMRFENVPTEKDFILINDAYNASPTSMKASIDTLTTVFPNKNKILVLGDMFELGKDALQLHYEIGRYLNNLDNKITYLVTVGMFSSNISEAFYGDKAHFSDLDSAADFLNKFNLPDFVILFKASRGMSFEKLVEKIK